jgi:hypothetical protein
MPVTPVSMSLNQVSRARAGTRSDHRAFSAANYRTSNGADTGADKRSFEPTVMRPAIVASGSPLRIDTQTSERAE